MERPALVVSWPTPRGHTAVLDVGANISCDARRLVEFAIMGAAFHHAVHGSKRATVGLLNVGSEDEKGHEEVREANRILREMALELDYMGFVEGDDIPKAVSYTHLDVYKRQRLGDHLLGERRAVRGRGRCVRQIFAAVQPRPALDLL